ncbi:Metacaspase-1A [Grifola frondosa]|uniref:Metacaspase-1A n=1 Tax=Grifola frondosa TaxID=5627 RepID=A0A1C7LSQ9_GRIFR|nr:Metacaspase-1A [Grifola frondosa]
MEIRSPRTGDGRSPRAKLLQVLDGCSQNLAINSGALWSCNTRAGQRPDCTYGRLKLLHIRVVLLLSFLSQTSSQVCAFTNPPPTMPGLPLRPVKKALCIGVQYTESYLREANPWIALHGTHKDPYTLRDLLVGYFGYKYEDKILIDDKSREHEWPTRDNIVNSMKELVADAQPGDHFVFHFSGHGYQVENLDGTEEDGYDEVIWPVDLEFKSIDDFSNYVKDDEIKEILVNHLPPGAHCVLVFDCCHSGTASDLPYMNGDVCPSSPISPLSASPRACGAKAFSAMSAVAAEFDTFTSRMEETSIDSDPTQPDVISWSACMDSQVTLEKGKGGIFVTAFAEALRRNPQQTHAELLRSVTRELANITEEANRKRRRDVEEFSTPRPQLGSLRQVAGLFDKIFTM